MVLFLRAPQLSSLVGSLGGSSCLNSILHAFFGLTSSHLHSAIFLSASPFFLWLPFLLNPSPLFIFAVDLGFVPFLHSLHSLPFFFFFSASLAPSCCVFSAASDLRPLHIPFLALPLGASESLRESQSLWLRGVMPGWEISLLWILISFLQLPHV